MGLCKVWLALKNGSAYTSSKYRIFKGERKGIIRRLEIILGRNKTESVYGHNDHNLKSGDALAMGYGFSSRNATQYLCLNYLIPPFKILMDGHKIALLVGVV